MERHAVPVHAELHPDRRFLRIDTANLEPERPPRVEERFEVRRLFLMLVRLQYPAAGAGVRPLRLGDPLGDSTRVHRRSVALPDLPMADASATVSSAKCDIEHDAGLVNGYGHEN